MVLTARDLELFVRGEESPHLLEGLGRDDEIARRRRGRLDGELHLRETMPIRRHHAHLLGAKLPQHAIENRPTLLGRDRERGMRDQLLQIARADAPALVESYRGKAREFVFRKSENLEVRLAAVECDA